MSCKVQKTKHLSRRKTCRVCYLFMIRLYIASALSPDRFFTGGGDQAETDLWTRSPVKILQRPGLQSVHCKMGSRYQGFQPVPVPLPAMSTGGIETDIAYTKYAFSMTLVWPTKF